MNGLYGQLSHEHMVKMIRKESKLDILMITIGRTDAFGEYMKLLWSCFTMIINISLCGHPL